MLPDQMLKALPSDALDFIRIQMISLASRHVKRETKLSLLYKGFDELIGVWSRIGRAPGLPRAVSCGSGLSFDEAGARTTWSNQQPDPCPSRRAHSSHVGKRLADDVSDRIGAEHQSLLFHQG